MRSMTRSRRRLAGLLSAAALLSAGGCGSAGVDVGQTSSTVRQAVVTPEPTGADRRLSEPGAPGPTQSVTGRPPLARRGVTAASNRIRFIPRHLDLPGGLSAAVQPARTVRGELQVPPNVDHIGWWDGSAYAGDPFGSVVLAGHIDSAEQGLGFFTALLEIRKGDLVTVRSGGEAMSYQVTSTALVDKDALASGTDTFDQQGRHRLVLITCWGRWRPEVHSYESNVVVVADPVPTGQE